ncbi:MAG: MATE family efflux transporter, partial [Clostridia bacterium]|nr:MATE family efflux transporter [Clostridia bacterium]
IQSSINSFDSSAIVAGNSAAVNIESFVYIGLDAFIQACMTFTSQNIGAGKFGRVKEIVKLTMVLTVASALGISLIVWGFGNVFLGFYTTDAEVIAVGMIRLTYVCLPLFLNGVLDVFVCSMRGMGYSLLPTVAQIVGICGVRLLWIFIAFPMFRSLEAVYLCYPISWAVTSVIQGIFWVRCHRSMLERNA